MLHMHLQYVITLGVIQATIPFQVVREHYGHFAREEATLRVIFMDSEITLNIPVDGLVTGEGWRITPFTTPTVRHAWTYTIMSMCAYCILILDLQERCRSV